MQAAPMPLESDPQQAGAPTQRGAVHIFVLILAVVETLSALANVPVLFAGMPDVPGPGLGGWTITAVIALSPPVAITALVFALTGRLRHAIAAIATLALLGWLTYLPSFILHGPGFDTSFGSIHALVQFLVFPVFAIAAVVLAVRNQRLGLATLMAGLPTLIGVLGVVAFGIGVAIYGF